MQLGADASVDITDLIGYTRFLTNTRDNTSAFAAADIKGLLNKKQGELQTFLLSNLMHDWKENTLQGAGSGLLNLVASTNTLTFPTGLLTLDRLELNYTGDTNGFVRADIIKHEAIDEALANTENDSAIVGSKSAPIAYVRDGKIYLDPIPDESITGGAKVWCTTLVTDLSATADEPVFVKPFHDILALEAAIEWLESRDKYNKAATLKERAQKRKFELLEFYANREQEDQPTIIPKVRNFD